MMVVDGRWLPDSIPQKWRAALARELEPAMLARLDDAYRRLAADDEISFVYLPGSGVTVRLNGRLLAEAGGHGVIDSILEAWADGERAEARLRRLAADHPC